MSNSTKTRQSDRQAQATKMEWHVFDAKDKVLGRLATKVAGLILGKHRLDFANNRVAPVSVVIINTDQVALTGQKELQKVYYRHSGYPGGLKQRTVAEQRRKDSRRIVHDAVAGMLPKNSLRTERLGHLRLYAGSEHPHQAQLSQLNQK